VSVIRMLAINLMDMLGWSRFKDEAIQLVSNRHFVIEGYQYESLMEGYRKGAGSAELSALGRTEKDAGYPAYSETYARDVITRESEARADGLDRALRETFPARWVDDPSYQFGDAAGSRDSLRTELAQHGTPESQKRMAEVLDDSMQRFGTHSRQFIRSVLAP
jgi:hypothetical protein